MKNFFLKLGVCALALTGAAEVLAQEQVIQLFAHRGSRFEYDENTLPAFKASYDAGLRGFETDIRMTRDGELVISHDETLARLTPCKRVVETMTADEIRKVKTNQGNDLIFLPELVDFFADKDNVYIEAGRELSRRAAARVLREGVQHGDGQETRQLALSVHVE